MIKAGFDHANPKAMKDIINKRNDDIESRKKKLKLVATEDPEAKELGETKIQKEEMLKLLVEKSAQIKEMEAEMDNMIKEKELSSQLAMVPLDAISIASLLQIGIPTSSTTIRTSSSPVPLSSIADDSIKLA